MKKRPFGVTVLAVLAGLAAVFAAIHALQALKILPYMIGPFTVHAFSFWSFLMWALMVWIWVWVVQMLWRVDPQAWLFLAVISVFNLILDFTVMLGAGDWSDVVWLYPIHHPDLRYASKRKRALWLIGWAIALGFSLRSVKVIQIRKIMATLTVFKFATLRLGRCWRRCNFRRWS
jgi:hypothetical protein